ncbi:hypothetical protein M3Y95_00637900 [Aphelenchoides besseyi]|nr:hypothetical protein M3Y95_00637900 [Aphelenchoides besseyi]
MSTPRAFCCHVHTCTFFIALTVVLFWLLVAVFIVIKGELLGLVVVIPPLFSYGCLLVGNRTNRPSSYCPFLIVNLALVIGAFIFAGIFYLTGAAFISHNFRIGSEVLETFLGSVTILTGTGVAIFAFLMFYYFYIVYRDYEYVKQKVAKKEVDSPTKSRPKQQKRFYVLPSTKRPTKSKSLRRNQSSERIIVDVEDVNDRLSFSSIDNQPKWQSEQNLPDWSEEPRSFDRPFNRNPSIGQLNHLSQSWRITSV